MLPDLNLQHLIVERPVAVLDVESTGLDVQQDRVIEVAVLKLEPGAPLAFFHTLVDPERPIPAEATQVHGLTDLDVHGQPAFRQIAQPLAQFLLDYDLVGFGLVRFDLPLLTAEWARLGYRFPLNGRAIVDVLELYRRRERRDLASAVKYYLGRDHIPVHQASADVQATLEVLDAQIGRYGLPRTTAGLHAELVEVDIAGRFGRDRSGRVVFNFGQHRGQTLESVAVNAPGYLKWILRQPFLADVHALVRSALSGARFPRTSDS
jgi:DNA polymerase-3 subunit epsilon